MGSDGVCLTDFDGLLPGLAVNGVQWKHFDCHGSQETMDADGLLWSVLD